MRNALPVPWLGLSLLLRPRSIPGRGLRYHKPLSTAKKKERNTMKQETIENHPTGKPAESWPEVDR